MVAQYFPELDKSWNRFEAENLSIVRWCLSPHEMKKLRFEKFCKMVVPQYRTEKQYETIFKIWTMSPYSIGCQAGIALELEAKILVEGLRNIQKQIVDVEKTIEDLCLCFDDYKLLFLQSYWRQLAILADFKLQKSS